MKGENQDIFDFAKNGKLDKIKELKGSFDVNKADLQDKYTPLMWAAKNGFDDVVKYFIQCDEFDSKINLNQKGGWNDSTALIKAAENDKIKVVEALIDGGADLNMLNDFKSTALMLAAERGFETIVTLLAKKAKTDLQNEDGYTALILAAENGFANIVRILCAQGANIEIGNKFGKTALIMAAEFNRIECLKILLEFNADVNHTSKRGMTALMLAAVKGNKEIVELLLEHRNKETVELLGNEMMTDVNIEMPDGTTALSFSFFPESDKESDIAKLLIVHGASKDHCDKNGVTILMKAAEGGRLSIMDELLCDKDEIMYCNKQSKDKCTAMHYAASKGHVKVLIYLMDHGGDTKLENQSGQTALDVLKDFYVKGNEKTFKTFVDIAKDRRELLEMMSDILPEFKSPNSILNSYFHEILFGVKTADDVEIVTSLVHLAVGIKKSYKKNELEKPDLKERLASVNKMLVECMLSDALDNDDNVVRVFQDNQMRCLEDHRKDVVSVRDARGFMEGPLSLCIQHKLLAILGTRQVTIHVDTVFHSSLRQKYSRPIYGFGDILQMRSNFVNFRSCPSVNFYLDGISRLATFVLIGVLVVNFYISDDDNHIGATYNGRATENILIVMIVATVLHEIGEFQESGWKLKGYFKEIWNYLDIAAIVLLLAWLGLSFRNGIRQDFFPFSSQTYNTSTINNGTSTDVTSSVYFSQHADAIACLATSAVPMSIGLLQYISTQQELGQLVLTVFGMGADLGKFLVVFMVSVAGFGIAFHGMFAYTPSADDTRNFHTVEGTVYTLFDAALGQHDFGLFANDDYHIWGTVLFFVYISLTMIILLNLVIATFSATYDKMKEEAVNRWCLMKARLVQTYLLIEEGSPLSMLPAPLNLVPTILLPFHYLIIAFTRELMLGDKLNDFRLMWEKYSRMSEKKKNEIRQRKKCRALSLCGTVSDKLMSLVLLIPFTFYEIYLCLQDIKKQAAHPRTFYCFLAFTIIVFPVVYLIFIIILAYEIFKVKSILEIDENGYSELKHHITKKKREKTTPNIDLKVAYIKLNIKIIRAEFSNLTKYSLFSKPELFAQIKVNDQWLVTKPVTSSEMKPLWAECKDFLVSFSDQKRRIEISICDQYDGRIMGRYEGSFEKWIANGRYEGAVALTDQNNENVGKADIVVKVSMVRPNGTNMVHSQFSPRGGPPSTHHHLNITNQKVNVFYSASAIPNSESINAVHNEGEEESKQTTLLPDSVSLSMPNISEGENVLHETSLTAVEEENKKPTKKRKIRRNNGKIAAEPPPRMENTTDTTTGTCTNVIPAENDQNNKGNEIFTDADRERIFHGVGSEKANSYFRKNPFAYEIHTEIKQLLGVEIKQLLNDEMKLLLEELDTKFSSELKSIKNQVNKADA